MTPRSQAPSLQNVNIEVGEPGIFSHISTVGRKEVERS